MQKQKLEAVNWRFLRVYASIEKPIYVGTSDVGFIAENLRILKYCLLKVLQYVDKNAKFQVYLSQN